MEKTQVVGIVDYHGNTYLYFSVSAEEALTLYNSTPGNEKIAPEHLSDHLFKFVFRDGFQIDRNAHIHPF